MHGGLIDIDASADTCAYLPQKSIFKISCLQLITGWVVVVLSATKAFCPAKNAVIYGGYL